MFCGEGTTQNGGEKKKKNPSWLAEGEPFVLKGRKKNPKRGSERKQIRTEKGKREKSPPKGKDRRNERKSFWKVANGGGRIRDMTTLRIENRKIKNLQWLLMHLENPPTEEVLKVGWKIPREGLEEWELTALQKVQERYKTAKGYKERVKILKEVFKEYESEFGRRSLRKDASLREIIMSFEEGKGLERVKEELNNLIRVLEKELGFVPFGLVYLHRKEGRYHIHYLLSTKNPKTRKKVNLYRHKWFKIVEETLDEESRKQLRKKQKVGNIPLWLIRKIARKVEKEVGKEEADRLSRELVRGLRKLGVKRKYIFEIPNKEAKEIIHLWERVKKRVEEMEKVKNELEGEFVGNEPVKVEGRKENQKREFTSENLSEMGEDIPEERIRELVRKRQEEFFTSEKPNEGGKEKKPESGKKGLRFFRF